MKSKQIWWEVATLNGIRERFRNYSKAREYWEGLRIKAWLEEYHGNKLVRAESRNG